MSLVLNSSSCPAFKKANENKNIPIFEELKTQNQNSMNFSLLPNAKLPVARKVIRKGDRNHHVGFFASRINKALVPYESSLEKDACVYFESKPEITKYISQPLGIKLVIAGKEKTIYPDFEITMADKKALIDIKYFKKSQQAVFVARTEAMMSYARQRDIAYSVITEKDLKKERLEVVRWLISMARGIPSKLLEETVYYWIGDKSSQTTYQEILNMTNNYPAVQAVIAGFILDGILVADLDKPLFQQTLCITLETKGGK